MLSTSNKQNVYFVILPSLLVHLFLYFYLFIILYWKATDQCKVKESLGYKYVCFDDESNGNG